MKSFSFSFTHAPPVTKRGGQVLIALFSKDLKVLYLSRKNAYPDGIYRLFGGGIDANEDPLQTAPRELFEETLIEANIEEFTEINQFEYHILEQSTHKKINFSVYLYQFLIPLDSSITPSDDVDAYQVFNQEQLAELVQKYQNLSTKLNTAMDGGAFRWSDYGQVFAPVHQTVLDYWKSI